jgi:ATP diphosphatase
LNIQRLLDVMAALRNPQTGCPWDLQQEFRTIAPYTIEEAYEVADAIDRNDMADLREELGDLLLQVVFHAQMAQEQKAFAFDDVVTAIVDKMVSRHPHVFGAEHVADAQAQTELWEQHKQREREAKGEQDTSALAGVTRGLPEWQRAIKLQKRAARSGFEWPSTEPVIAKLREELKEVEDEIEAQRNGADNKDRIEEEVGDLLFVAVNLARHLEVDPGTALRTANRKFDTRFRSMEALAKAQGSVFKDLPLSELEMMWNRVK